MIFTLSTREQAIQLYIAQLVVHDVLYHTIAAAPMKPTEVEIRCFISCKGQRRVLKSCIHITICSHAFIPHVISGHAGNVLPRLHAMQYYIDKVSLRL